MELSQQPSERRKKLPLRGLSTDLTQLRGVVIRQETQVLQAIAQLINLPYEARNRYKISALPEGKRVGRLGSSKDVRKGVFGDDEGEEWWPGNDELARLPTLFWAQEESPCWRRTCLTIFGCNSQRCLEMHFYEAAVQPDSGGISQQPRVFSLRRPLRLGLKTVVPLCVGLGELVGQIIAIALDKPVLHFIGLSAGLLLGVLLLLFFPNHLRLRMEVVAPMARSGEQNADKDTEGLLDASAGIKLDSVGSPPLPASCGIQDGVWDDQEIGLVEEALEPRPGEFSACQQCWTCCCLCTNFTRLTEKNVDSVSDRRSNHVYTTRASMCCCGNHNNCFGATCCNEAFVIEILDPSTEGASGLSSLPLLQQPESGSGSSSANTLPVMANLVKLYAPDKHCASLCRCYNGFSQYIVEFPTEATQNQRMLLLASFISTDLEFFDNNK